MNQGQGSPNNAKIQSFLEALRASRGASPSQNGVESRPNPFGEFQAKKETESRRIELFHQARQQEWNKVFSSKERAVVQKIETIREQLKELTAKLKNLDKNLKKAVQTDIVSYGDYQIGYLEHISKAIRIWQMSVNSTNTWLELFNDRVSKKGVYWQMANSKGNNYTQSNERQVATSVG